MSNFTEDFNGDMEDLSELEGRIEVLEAERAGMKAAMRAIREYLLIFDSLILYPTYQKKLDRYEGAEKGMVELAMKANFFKTSYDIRKMTKRDMQERRSKQHRGE
ncbi:hypothetical protein SUGI_0042490 [Cryptomeria japonica]|nr:hypothetical protein SUGI_0042490 [Cryptomeria japonica]